MRRVFDNFGLKILALFLATILWYVVSSKGISEITLDVPIEFVNVPQGYEIVWRNKDSVKVNLLGNERILESIKKKGIKVKIDLKNTKNRGTFVITKKDLNLPSAVTITAIRPSKIKVRLEKIGEKK